MKCLRNELVLMFLQTVFIVSIVLVSVIPVSCKATEQGIEIIGGDYKSPCLKNINVLDNKTVKLEFTDAVSVRNVVVSLFIKNISDSQEHSIGIELSPSLAAACGEYGVIESSQQISENGKEITFLLENETQVGLKYEIFGTVEDKAGNSLTFCVPFIGYNPSVPKMIITEAQIKYAKATVSGNVLYRTEFIELMALEDGNLAGIEIISACDGEKGKFVLPAVEVKKGEIILVHPRTKEAGCINEQGDDLNLAIAPFSKDGVRDLWSENENSRYNDSTDVIYLFNTVNNSVMDGFVYAAENLTEWKTEVSETVDLLFAEGIFKSKDISAAVLSKGVSPLKSLTRINASEINKKVMNDEEIDFPIVYDSSNWSVCSVSPGDL